MISNDKIWSKPLFWLGLYFIFRLYGITNPPLESGHNWRQTTVTMVARNFYEVDNDITKPRIDIAGDQSGITGMEFPVMNYLIYGTSEVFGYTHWYGRLINLIVSTFGLYFFYLLILRYFDQKTALYALTVLLGGSIWFNFTRKIMPDTFSVSLVLAAIYFGIKYLYDKSNKGLIIYLLLALIGVLAKIPSGYLLGVFLIPIVDKRISLSRKLIFCGSSIVIMIPVGWWYFQWSPYLEEHYGFSHFFAGKGVIEGAKETFENFDMVIWRFVNSAAGFTGFSLFIGGLIVSMKSREKILIRTLLILFPLFIVIIFKAGFAFYHHDYYIIPFVPVMAVFIGYCLSKIQMKWLLIACLSLLILENTLTRMKDFTLEENRKWPLALDNELDQFMDKEALIAINTGDFPTIMYFSHRKGWTKFSEELSQVKCHEDLKNTGCHYILWIEGQTEKDVKLNLPLVHQTDHYRLYSLR